MEVRVLNNCPPFANVLTPAKTEVLSPTHLLCAITFSCDHVGASINGTHLISWCGQLISREQEQKQLINFLQEFMEKTKWPNQTCCDRLQRIWTGQNESWITHV